jgi:membrane associated rhomboid family serine protease
MAFIPIYDTNPLRHIRRPWVAWGIIATNVFVYFFLQRGFTGEASEASVVSFGLIPALFVDNEAVVNNVPGWLTIVTSAFLHGDVWHLIGNMIYLWVLADNVEDALGHLRYFAFYLLCAVAAGGAVVVADPTSTYPVVGASGAVAGTVAAYLILTPRAKIWVLLFARIPLRLSAMWVLGSWVVIQVISVLAAEDDGIAWWAHIGGLVAGAVLILVMRRKGVHLFGEVHSPVPAPVGPDPAAVPRAPPPPPGEPRGPWG